VVEVHRAVAAVGIIGFGGFPQGVAHAHPGAAHQLLLHQPGVQRAADLVGRFHVQHRDLAGLVIHLDLDEHRGMGEARDRRHLAGFGIDRGQRDQEDAAPGDGAALLELRGLRGGHGGDGARRRALHVDVALAVGHEVGGVDLQLLGRRLQHHGAGLERGHDHGIADAVRAARGEGAHVMRAGVAVGGVDIDIGHRDAQRLGGDLAGDGLHPLPEVDGRQRDGELAVRVGVDQRLARVAAEVHADGIVDRREAAAAVQGHVSAS
jgi:hypothetical protein